jgi:dTDP-4-amino-4,6-dideoxygalactose transaminase
MIGLADFQRQWEISRAAYLEAVDRVGKSGWLVLGAEVAQFEADLARFWGVKHALGCASGLDALEMAFRAAGMGPGDRVLTTPLSAFATTLAALRVGAVPVFADVDQSGLLDLDDAARVLSALDGPVRFIVPVHLFGHAMDLVRLRRFAQTQGTTVIEDCAQAIGARSRAERVGAVSAVCATSFYPTKNLGAFGDGGALLTNDEDIWNFTARLRDYGQSEKYVHTEIGLNSRLDELQAALLRSVQLPKLGADTARRREVARRYLVGIRHALVKPVPVPDGSDSVWHLFPVLVAKDRAGFRTHLSNRGVASAVHYPKLIPHQPAMAAYGLASNRERRFEVAEEFAAHELSLPIHAFLTDEEVQTVIDACNSWEAR